MVSDSMKGRSEDVISTTASKETEPKLKSKAKVLSLK